MNRNLAGLWVTGGQGAGGTDGRRVSWGFAYWQPQHVMWCLWCVKTLRPAMIRSCARAGGGALRHVTTRVHP